MKISEVVKDHATLKKNYEVLLADAAMPIRPVEAIINPILEMPTTHTFGYEKVLFINKAKNLVKTIYPARSILFEDKALLADETRRKRKKFVEFEFARKMTKAREYGLDEYVFSYLGIHEYYYSQCAGMNVPAFGVFLSSRLDSTMEGSNATLFDLESKLAAKFKPEEITMFSVDARKFVAYEVCNKYKNDFLNYWIDKNYSTTQSFGDSMWEDKKEFHYYEKVEIENIQAIIWPVELRYVPGTRRLAVKDALKKEIGVFEGLFPAIRIFTYIWNGEEGLERFSTASKIIGDQLYKTGDLPDNALFHDSFMSAFPKPRI